MYLHSLKINWSCWIISYITVPNNRKTKSVIPFTCSTFILIQKALNWIFTISSVKQHKNVLIYKPYEKKSFLVHVWLLDRDFCLLLIGTPCTTCTLQITVEWIEQSVIDGESLRSWQAEITNKHLLGLQATSLKC